MFPIIDIGPLAIQAAGLILLLSLWTGLWVSGKFAKNLSINGEAIETGIFYGLLAGILGARIGFLLQNPTVFTDNPLSVVSLTPTMLDGGFGLLVAGLTVFIIFQKKHLPLWPTLDTLTPLFLFIFAGLHLSDYANGNNFGLETTLPWGIQLWNAIRHPVQLYALLLALVLFIWLLVRTRVFKQTGFLHSGVLLSIVIADLALTTLFTRAFAAEKTLIFGVDLMQVIALLVLALSLYLLYSKAFKARNHIPVFLSLGANQNARTNLERANTTISTAFKIRSASGLYQTQDVRDNAETKYLNQVLEIETDLAYADLLAWSKDMESQFGRQPDDKDTVPLDVDIIVYNGDVFTFNGKQLPEPNLTRYAYIAVPLAEIAPEFHHPATGQSIQAILAKLEESQQPIERLSEVENGTQG